MALLFSASGLVVLPFWLLFMLAPGWRWTGQIARSPLISVVPAIAYAILAVPRLATVLPAVANPQLGAIAALLGTPEGATLAWTHFVAFDLLIGRWVFVESRERGVPWWISTPVLFFTFLLGPLGYLAHLGVRSVYPRRAA